jgi:hypothetical protein
VARERQRALAQEVRDERGYHNTEQADDRGLGVPSNERRLFALWNDPVIEAIEQHH